MTELIPIAGVALIFFCLVGWFYLRSRRISDVELDENPYGDTTGYGRGGEKWR